MLKGVTIATAIGLVFGVILVWWVRPDTSGGTTLLIASALIASIICRSIFSLFQYSRTKDPPPGTGKT